MKNNKLFYFGAFALLVACQNPKQEDGSREDQIAEDTVETATESNEENFANTVHFGKMIEADDAISMKEFSLLLGSKDSVKTKIHAVAEDVCQKKGCWMKVKTEEGKLMRVTFKDYGFFVPKDISGKKVVLDGIAVRDTVSVEELRHFAKDGGESEEAIAEITEAEITTTFIAEGVLIQE